MKLVKFQKKCCNKPKKFWNLQPKNWAKKTRRWQLPLWPMNVAMNSILSTVTQTVRQMLSALNINQNWNCLWRRGFTWKSRISRWCLSLMPILGNCSSQSIRLMSRLRNMVIALSVRWALAVHGFTYQRLWSLHSRRRSGDVPVYKKKFWQPMDSQDNKRKWKNRDLISSLEFALTGIFTAIKRRTQYTKHAVTAPVVQSAGFVFRCHESNGLFLPLSILVVIAF